MSVIDPRPVARRAGAHFGCYVFGRVLKEAADGAAPQPSYALAGRLYLSRSGWLLLSAPNALVRGVYDAMHEPGVELPPSGPAGALNAHISVMRPEEVERIGGPDKVAERGHAFRYNLGQLVAVEPDGWSDVALVWFLRVHSPELQALRRSYGLSSLPDEGRKPFHLTVAVRRRGVLGRNETAKGG